MLSVSIEADKLPDYFPSFMTYHSRYDSLSENDFERFFWDDTHMENFKGTKRHNSTLILIAAPYIATDEDTRVYNQISEIAKAQNLTFIDFNEFYNEIGLDFEKNFNDDSHLNYWGSCKFTKYLGSYL